MISKHKNLIDGILIISVIRGSNMEGIGNDRFYLYMMTYEAKLSTVG